RVEVGKAQKFTVAPGDFLQGERLHAVQTKVFTVERPHDVAVNERAFKVDGGELAVLLIGTREIANEAASKSITRAGGVAHILQRIGGRGKKAAVFAEEQRAIGPLLDDDH